MKKLLRTAAVVAAVTALANVARAAEDTVVSQSIALLQDCEFDGGGLNMGPSEAGNLPTKATLQIDADHAPLGTVGPLSLEFEAGDYTRWPFGSVYVVLSGPDGWRAFASGLGLTLRHGDLEVAELQCFKSWRGKTYKLSHIVVAADPGDYRRENSQFEGTLEAREMWAAIAAMPADLKKRAELAHAAYDHAPLRAALKEIKSIDGIAVDDQPNNTCFISNQAHVTSQRGIGARLYVNGAVANLKYDIRLSRNDERAYDDDMIHGPTIEMWRDNDGRPQRVKIDTHRVTFTYYCH